jgi:V/A-type H+-transporting ATPase subunit A
MRRQQAATLLQRETELQDIVQLVGPDALQDMERLVLEVSRLIREVFLQQSAFSENDASCEPGKVLWPARRPSSFTTKNAKRCCGARCRSHASSELPVREDIARLKEEPNEGFTAKKDACIENFKQVLGGLEAK